MSTAEEMLYWCVQSVQLVLCIVSYYILFFNDVKDDTFLSVRGLFGLSGTMTVMSWPSTPPSTLPLRFWRQCRASSLPWSAPWSMCLIGWTKLKPSNQIKQIHPAHRRRRQRPAPTNLQKAAQSECSHCMLGKWTEAVGYWFIGYKYCMPLILIQRWESCFVWSVSVRAAAVAVVPVKEGCYVEWWGSVWWPKASWLKMTWTWSWCSCAERNPPRHCCAPSVTTSHCRSR